MQSRIVAALSFILNYLFFFEYLPPFKRVHIPYDLDGFHFPLADYAFRSLRQGRFPEWDPSIYCGLSFVGNIQAALFYPVTWVLFAANIGRERLLYVSLEVLVILHVWLAFLLCFLWLRWKGLELLPSVFGAGIFAYSGYMLLQLQHQGLVVGYTWMPLGLWGIDHAVRSRSWRPLWKLATASALCLLAGYPPTWFVFCVCIGTYAVFQWRWKIVLGAVLAFGLSVLVASVQLFPSWEANKLKVPEMRYGTGIRNPEFFVSYLLPNYFDFGMQAPPNRRGEYLYLGAPALFGLACLMLRKAWRGHGALLAVGAVSLIIMTNPYGLVWEVVRHSSLLGQICRDWYFIAGITLAIAPLAAHGLNGFLKQKSRGAPHWLEILLLLLCVGWSVRQIGVWLPGGAEFAARWRAAMEPAVALVLFTLAVYALRGARGSVRAWLAMALLLMVVVDYKAFGTSKRFNTAEGRIDPPYRYRKFPGIDDALYQKLRANSAYRIALDDAGPLPLELRHHELTTPQGFDPFITTQYRQKVEKLANFRSNWEFHLDPANEKSLEQLAVGYFISSENGSRYQQLLSNSSFRLMEPADTIYKVFEFTKAQPPYRWDPSDPRATVRCTRWEPQVREFTVRSETGGRFALIEQFFPGWRAAIDEHPAPLEQWEQAFQAVRVPGGEHRVRFVFRSARLRVGTWVSAVSLVLLAVWAFSGRRLNRAESSES